MSAVLVDTCIWSMALRGKSPRDISASEELTKLIYVEKAKIMVLLDKSELGRLRPAIRE